MAHLLRLALGFALLSIFFQRGTGEPCLVKKSIHIIMDGARTVGVAGFASAKEFVARLAGTWNGNPENRMGVAKIAAGGWENIFVTPYVPGETEQKIRAITFPNNNLKTQTHYALNNARNHVRGDFTRNFTEQAVVLFTDGRSENPAATIVAANNLYQEGAQIFTVGIGSNINEPELLAIAQGNSNHVIGNTEVERLIVMFPPVSEGNCL